MEQDGWVPSRFNLAFDGPANGSLVIFNTLRGAMVEFDAEESVTMRGAMDSGDAAAIPAALRQGLLDCGILVPTTLDELAIVRARKTTGVADSNRLDVVVMPTIDCNFRCVYCYEKHAGSSMAVPVRDSLVAFLEREIPKFKGVMLHWYGGEPLLEPETVLVVTDAATRVAGAAGATLALQMTTNGYLLTEDVARPLVQAGLREYQVTIDGAREAHDRLRPLGGGDPSFDVVLANTIAVLRSSSEVQVSVRVNFNETNAGDVLPLLDQFPDDVRDRIRFVFEPIFGHCSVRARAAIEDEEISRLLRSWHEHAAAGGYASSVGGVHAGKLVYCYAERENQLVVSYDGAVFKCPVCDFTTEAPVGRLSSDGTIARYDDWTLWMDVPAFDSACEACVFSPLCMGGCRRERLKTGGLGDTCALVPQNVSYVLKQIALQCEDGLIPLLGLTAHHGGEASI